MSLRAAPAKKAEVSQPEPERQPELHPERQASQPELPPEMALHLLQVLPTVKHLQRQAWLELRALKTPRAKVLHRHRLLPPTLTSEMENTIPVLQLRCQHFDLLHHPLLQPSLLLRYST